MFYKKVNTNILLQVRKSFKDLSLGPFPLGNVKIVAYLFLHYPFAFELMYNSFQLHIVLQGCLGRKFLSSD